MLLIRSVIGLEIALLCHLVCVGRASPPRKGMVGTDVDVQIDDEAFPAKSTGPSNMKMAYVGRVRQPDGMNTDLSGYTDEYGAPRQKVRINVRDPVPEPAPEFDDSSLIKIPLLSSLVGGLLGSMGSLGRRKRNAEADNPNLTMADYLKKGLEIFKFDEKSNAEKEKLFKKTVQSIFPPSNGFVFKEPPPANNDTQDVGSIVYDDGRPATTEITPKPDDKFYQNPRNMGMRFTSALGQQILRLLFGDVKFDVDFKDLMHAQVDLKSDKGRPHQQKPIGEFLALEVGLKGADKTGKVVNFKSGDPKTFGVDGYVTNT